MKNKVNPTQHLHLHQHQPASAVTADWLIAPSLQYVRVDTQYVGINEEQKQQIGQLQEEPADFNCV